jgi:MOSC domain-containing protein YiiM
MEAIRQGLQEALRGRRGILCRVVKSGQIRRGDSIEIIEGQAPRKTEAPAEKHA